VNRRIAINLGVFSLVFALMIYWAVNNIVTIDAIERPYEIAGQFEQAAGVRANSEVTYLGVHYGRVSKVERRVGGVTIRMSIERGKRLPQGAIARIFRKSAIGEPYIDFAPPPDGYPKTGTIPKGTVIPETETIDGKQIVRTTTPLEFSELLRSASDLVGSIDPKKAGSLVHELALGLQGRGQDLRDLTTGFDRITSVFASRTDALDRLADNNTKLVHVLADHRLSIGRSITNLRQVAEALRDSKGDLEALFRDGPAFLTTTADLVADQKRNLDCLLTDLAPVLSLAADHSADLAVLLEKGPIGFGYIYSALDRDPDGTWIRVNLQVPVTGTPAKIYTPRATLPVVPTVSPCASTMVPASVFPVDGSGGATGAASLDATAGARSSGPATGLSPASAREVLRHPADVTGTGAPVPTLIALVLLAGVAGGLATTRGRARR
jgi:phospholipid/cholesterol/gamma-HCH transport system substrate-binding protein